MIEFVTKPAIAGQYADGRAQYQTDPPIDLPVPGAPIQDYFAGLVSLETAQANLRAYRERLEASEANWPRKTQWFDLGYHVDVEAGLTLYYQQKFFDHQNPPKTWANWPATPPVYEENS